MLGNKGKERMFNHTETPPPRKMLVAPDQSGTPKGFVRIRFQNSDGSLSEESVCIPGHEWMQNMFKVVRGSKFAQSVYDSLIDPKHFTNTMRGDGEGI